MFHVIIPNKEAIESSYVHLLHAIRKREYKQSTWTEGTLHLFSKESISSCLLAHVRNPRDEILLTLIDSTWKEAGLHTQSRLDFVWELKL